MPLQVQCGISESDNKSFAKISFPSIGLFVVIILSTKACLYLDTRKEGGGERSKQNTKKYYRILNGNPALPQVTWPGEALLGNNDTNNAGRILKIVAWQLLAHTFAIPLQLCNPRELCFCQAKCKACTVGSISLVSTALPILLKITSPASAHQTSGLFFFLHVKTLALFGGWECYVAHLPYIRHSQHKTARCHHGALLPQPIDSGSTLSTKSALCAARRDLHRRCSAKPHLDLWAKQQAESLVCGADVIPLPAVISFLQPLHL